jgi:hypothetical protein
MMLRDLDDTMHMIRHDDKFVQLHIGKMPWNVPPQFAGHFAHREIPQPSAVYHREHAADVMKANSDEIETCRRIVMPPKTV